MYFYALYLFHREGNGTPLQYSCLENPMDGGPWWAAVMSVLVGLINGSITTLVSSRTGDSHDFFPFKFVLNFIDPDFLH